MFVTSKKMTVCNEQKNDRGCSGNYPGNVSECLF